MAETQLLTISLSGTFSGVTNVPAGILTALNYGSNFVQLVLTDAGSIGNGFGFTKNRKSTLSYLLGLSGVAALQPLLVDLSTLTYSQMKAALDSISPARNFSSAALSSQISFGLGDLFIRHLGEGRVLEEMQKKQNGKTAKIAKALEEKGDALIALEAAQYLVANLPVGFVTDQDEIAMNKISKKNASRAAGQARTIAAQRDRNAFWGAGFGESVTLDKQNQNPRIQDTASGVIIAFDGYRDTGMFTFSSGYVHNNLKESGGAGKGSSDGAIIAVYGTKYLSNGYIDCGMLFGYNHYRMTRNIVIGGTTPFNGKAKSKFNDWQIMPHIGGGYDAVFNWGIIEPFANVAWILNYYPTYQETGASPLNNRINSGSPSILRSQVGLHFYETWDSEKYICILEESASYVNQAAFNTKMSSAIIFAPAALATGAPRSFTLETYNKVLNLVTGGVEVFYKHKPSKFFFSAVYQGEYGKRYLSNQIQVQLGVFF